ncbi:leucine-rich repeat domain-containing protein [Pseudomonas proteolytica]|nr:leucine-rich repeat domain-containing protein [Pseudomonas proteolytica]
MLDFSELSLGDLPRLPTYFAHVTELNLSRTRLTAQGSNEFLRAFTHVRTLTLSHNGLSAIPDALAEFRALRRLDMASNELQTAAQLSAQRELEWLDLSGNLLTEVELGGLARLDTLYLQHNLLDDWPMAVLEMPRLRTLDLQDNWIETLPAAALEPQYRQLLAGTDLSRNRLEQPACERLQVYLAQTGNGLGFSAEQLDVMIRGYRERDELAAFDSPDYSHNHPDIETPQEQKARWFAGVAPYSSKHRLWNELFAQEGSTDFSSCSRSCAIPRTFLRRRRT